MSNFETQYEAALADAKRETLVKMLRESPKMTIGQLQELGQGDLREILFGITFGEILQDPADESAPTGAESAETEPAAAPEETQAPRKKPSKKPKAVNTRTPAGRKEFDESVRTAISKVASKADGGYVAIGEFRGITGGTESQLRSSLARLIEKGVVTWTGQARSTKYGLVA